MTTVNTSDALFFRVDMPGHIKHRSGDLFDHIYLSYGDMTLPSTEFTADFPPDGPFPVSARQAIAARSIHSSVSGRSGR